jgi:hypothetical protein
VSDAFSDIAKDGYRAVAVSDYYDALLEWLRDQTPGKEEKVKRLAAYADDMGGYGYWSSPTGLKKRLEERLKKLAANDEPEWVAVIAGLEPWSAGDFLELSPFKGMTLVMHKGAWNPAMVGVGSECRHFKWVWNDEKYQIGDNGRWEAYKLGG